MFLKYNLWVILWALLILVMCGIPGEDIPHISFLETIHFDKIVHFALFFVLVLLAIRGFSLQSSFTILQQHPKVIAFVVSIIYGGSIEVMQETLFKHRSGDVFDFIADSLGVTCGFILYNTPKDILKSKFAK